MKSRRKMKSSGIPWLGDVPEGWGTCRVGYLMTEMNRRSADGKEEPLSMSQKLGIVPSREIEVANPASSYVGAKIVAPGDLVLNKLKAHLGVFAISKHDGVVSPDYSVYRVNNDVSTSYLNCLFHTPICISEFRRRITGVAVGFNRLYTSEFFKIQVPLPPLSEQRAIAERIDREVTRVDALREKINREIERLGDYKKSLIAEAVAGRVAGGRVSSRAERPMKPSGIPWLGDVPEGWVIDKVKYWFKATNTRGSTTLQLLSATQKYGMYPQSKLEGIVQVAEKTDLNTFKTVHVDDFVISLRSFQGGIERSDFEGVCSPAYQTFHAIREINTGYFKYLFKSHGFIEAINRLTVGIREGKTINYSDVREMNIPLPPIPEQREIAEYLDRAVSRIDAVVARRKTQLEKLESFKRSLIQEYVTGKREVCL